jgi:hypothetical protein
MDGVTATAAELNIIDGVTATTAELNYVDGVTSAVQTQLDAKQATDADLTDLADGTLTATKVENGNYFISSAGTSGQVWTSDGSDEGGWASTGSFTTASASTALQTPLIEYTDGDDAISIADGGGVTANANLTVKNGASSAGGVTFYEESDDGSNYVILQAATMGSDVTLTLPPTDGSANDVLQTNGSGVMTWVARSSVDDATDLSDVLVEATGSIYVANDPASTTNGANYNSALGTTALDAITTGDYNVAVPKAEL